MQQNPFSIYDFLGYMIPGSFLILVFDFYEVITLGEMFPKIAEEFAKNELLYAFAFLLFSYLIGHVISIVSSFTIEIFSNYSNGGYPSVYLFGYRRKYFSSESNYGNIGRFFLALFVWPISIFRILLVNDFYVVKQLNKARKLPSALSQVIINCCEHVLINKMSICFDPDCFGKDKGISGDLFRLLSHYAFEHSERHSPKLQNYVALYGFSRNICCAFLIVCWFRLFSVINLSYGLEPEFSLSISFNGSFLNGFILSFLTYMFYLGFVKFYRRFTLEALMACCVIEKK